MKKKTIEEVAPITEKKTRKTRSDKGKPRKKKSPVLEVKDAELLPKNETFFVAGRTWSSMDIKRFDMLEGRNIEDTLIEAYYRTFHIDKDTELSEAQRSAWLNRCRCRVNNEDVPRSKWATETPKAGSFIEFLVAPAGGGGGGGKGVLQPIMMIAVAIASIYTFGAASTLYGAYMGAYMGAVGFQGITTAGVMAMQGLAYVTAGVASMAVATIGSMIVNKICPTTVASPQSKISDSSSESSQTYSISGGRNSSNLYGYLPLVLGKYRVTPPLGAKSWTDVEGDNVYYNMLVVWGHPDMRVSDFRLGETSLSVYEEDNDGNDIVVHQFHQATYGNDLRFFNKSYDEQNVGEELAFDHDDEADAGQWHYKELGECDEISLDIYFAALTDLSSGDPEAASVDFEIEYAPSETPPESNLWVKFESPITFTAENDQYVETYTGASKNDLWCRYDGQFIARQEGDWDNDDWAVGKVRVPLSTSDYISVVRLDSPVSRKLVLVGANNTKLYYRLATSDDLESNVIKLFRGRDITGKIVGYWNKYPISSYKDKHKHHEWRIDNNVTFTSTERGIFRCTADDTTGVTFNARWAVPNGSYMVRVRRSSRDTGDSSIQDTATWKIARSIVHRPVFNTPLPICVSELRIKASDTFNGYVDNFSAVCESEIPVFNEETGSWDAITNVNIDTELNGKNWDGKSKPGVLTSITHEASKEYIGRYVERRVSDAASKKEFNVGVTRNPADILHYVFTSRHALNNPYISSKINEESFAKFWKWCDSQNYKFDFVCDSEDAAWSRWVSIASAGRGAITLDQDGLFSITIDNANKSPVQMFTPRNSWGFSIERQFYKMPHALRVSYNQEVETISKDSKGGTYTTYENRDGFIYADGYDKSTATDILEWNFTGKTDWDDLYKMGRYYLAATKLRPVSVKLNTDWEWLLCHRGDIVTVSHDVLMNTFGTARITALIYDNGDGTYRYSTQNYVSGDFPVGVKIDDTVVFSEKTGYGISVRLNSWSNGPGYVVVYRINDDYMMETDELIFTDPLAAKAKVPYVGALCSISTLQNDDPSDSSFQSDNREEYIVVSINVSGSDNSAELELAPWKAKEILASVNAEIPEWTTPIIKTRVSSLNNALDAPKIYRIRTDSSVMIKSGDSLISCLAVWWTLPKSGLPDTFKRVYCQLQVTDGRGTTKTAQADVSEEKYVYVTGVEDKKTYKARIRLVSDTGVTSPWSAWSTVKVVGKTDLPANVRNFRLAIEDPIGIRATWTANNDFDLSHYKLSGFYETTSRTPNIIINPGTYIGKVEESIVAVDTGNRVSAVPSTSSVNIQAPGKPTIDLAELWDSGIRVETTWKKTTWSIAEGEYISGNTSMLSTVDDTVISIGTSFTKGQKVKAREKDIFGNWSAQAIKEVTYYLPETPSVTLSTVKSTGVITADWDGCENVYLGENAPTIAVYSITGGIASNEKSGVARTSSLHYESKVSPKNYDVDNGYKANGSHSYTVKVQAKATDKYRISGEKSGIVSIIINSPPSPNIKTGGYAKLLDDGVNIVFTCGEGTWDTDYYRVESCDGTDVQTSKTKSFVFPCPAKWTPYSTLNVAAYDIMGLSSKPCDDYEIIWYTPQAPDVTLGVNKLNGNMTIDWQDCRNTSEENTPRIAYYTVAGTLVNTESKHKIVSVTGTHYESIVPLTAYEYGTQTEDGIQVQVGTVYVLVTAHDKYGVTNHDVHKGEVDVDNSKSFSIYPPYNPTEMNIASSEEGNSIILRWKDCERTFAIDYYRVVDVANNSQEYIIDSNYVVLPARKSGSYDVYVSAIDILGQESSAMRYTMTIANVGEMEVNARVDGSDILVEWSVPMSAFGIDYYIVAESNKPVADLGNWILTLKDMLDGKIMRDDDLIIGKAKTNYFRVPAGVARKYTFYVWAVDLAGNTSADLSCFNSITITKPSAPTVSAISTGSAIQLNWSTNVNSSTGQLPIVSYDVVREYEYDRGDIVETLEEEYGNYSLDTLDVPPVKAGTQWFRVRSVDTGGNVSESWGEAEYEVIKPSDPKFATTNVIVNQAQFWWLAPTKATFDISHYVMYELDDAGHSNKLLETDALYASNSESVGGDYKYGLTAVDLAGNESDMSTVKIKLDSPVGFVLFYDVDSTFGGTKSHFVLDGNGGLIGPIVDDETWLMSAPSDTTKWTNRTVSNSSPWLTEHSSSSGYYQETVPIGTLVASSKITVTADYDVLDGEPEVSCTIHTYKDSTSIATSEGWTYFGNEFNKVVYKITVTGGIVLINNIKFTLDIQRKTDFGTVHALATDCIESDGTTLKGSSTIGTRVDFGVDFIDVEVPIEVKPVSQDTGYNAFVVFDDVYKPTGFRVALFDKQGLPIDGDVMWQAHGV